MAGAKRGGRAVPEEKSGQQTKAQKRRRRTRAGELVRRTHKDGPQRMRARPKSWTPEAEAVFLDHLAASCNVSWSAAQAGFSAPTLYNHRRTDPGFAARWQAALEQGYARLEVELVGTAGRYLERLKLDPDLPLKAMSVKDAISILGLHRAAVRAGPSRRRGWQGRPRSLEEVRDSILKKLEAIEAYRRSGAGPSGRNGQSEDRDGPWKAGDGAP